MMTTSEGRRELARAKKELAAAEDRAMRTDAQRRRSAAKADTLRRLAARTDEVRAQVSAIAPPSSIPSALASVHRRPVDVECARSTQQRRDAVTSLLIQAIVWVIALLHGVVAMLEGSYGELPVV
jgi:hypothetical protein